MSDRFKDVNDFLPTWDCRFKGKGEEREALKADKNSFVVGHLISSREANIDGNDYVIHKMRIIECGNHDHLSVDWDGKDPLEVEFFGTHVINAILADPSKVAPGDCIMVAWNGKVDPKTNKGRGKPYDAWKVFQDSETPAVTVKNGVIVADGDSSDNDIAADETPSSPAPKEEKAEAAPKSEPATNAAPTEEVEEDDDDLPF
jgi:hypothetical protein